jgi:predicted DNA-binding transcriptional regulator AlpA
MGSAVTAATSELLSNAAAVVNGRPLVLSAADLARDLRVSVKTIWRLDASGKIPRPIRVGRLLRWDRGEIVRWIAAGGPPRSEWEALRD